VTLPPLPSLRDLTRELRALHAARSHPDAGGEYVELCLNQVDCSGTLRWEICAVGVADYMGALVSLRCGREYVPGSRACPECDGMALSPGTFATPCSGCDGTGHVPTPFDATAAARRLLAAARDGGAQ
jgi:hypothetical protein